MNSLASSLNDISSDGLSSLKLWDFRSFQWYLSSLGLPLSCLVTIYHQTVYYFMSQVNNTSTNTNSINQQSHHSAAEHRSSTRFLHRTLFSAMYLIPAQDFFTPLASSSTVLRHVFFGLPLLRFPWGFHSRACLVISSVDFRGVWLSHPHLRFLICKSILGWFVRFHSSLFVIWSGQKIHSIFLKLLLINIWSLVVIYFKYF